MIVQYKTNNAIVSTNNSHIQLKLQILSTKTILPQTESEDSHTVVYSYQHFSHRTRRNKKHTLSTVILKCVYKIMHQEI